MPQTVTLTIGDKKLELPVIEGTEQEKAIDISQLRAQTGYITLDPGYGNTGSCKSAITFIDGEAGILRHRGYPIDQLAGQASFLEVAWMIIFGRLPEKAELERFERKIAVQSEVAPQFQKMFDLLPQKLATMPALASMASALESFHPELAKPSDPKAFEDIAAALMANMRTLSAYAYRRSLGLPYNEPDGGASYAGGFLRMLFDKPTTRYDLTAEVEEAMNLMLVLHADHEQNCSTSTLRMVASSEASLFSSIAAAICALSGPLHGGANAEVIDMLKKVHMGGLTPEQYIAMAKDKNTGVRLMGFGHRVYKNFDPRAKILKDSCDKVLAKLKVADPLLEIARKLEEQALKDSYFVERKLYPNVDFYSGIIMRAIGLPTEMFTVMFALGRMPGWIGHFKEQFEENARRISRPRQVYTGHTKTDFVPGDQRWTK